MTRGHGGTRARLLASVLAAALIGCLFAGCAGFTPASSGGGGSTDTKAVKIDPVQGQRVSNIMLPLVKNMNHPVAAKDVKLGVYNSSDINAANAGSGQFYVTSGLLEKANDEQLRGVLAHEIAHQDLGHVAKTKALGTGLQIGSVLLDQILPGSGLITPYVADIGVLRPYSRQEEYEADAHAVTILDRAGYNGKQVMSDTLSWLLQVSGPSGGSFFAHHPGTEDRIKRIQAMQ